MLGIGRLRIQQDCRSGAGHAARDHGHRARRGRHLSRRKAGKTGVCDRRGRIRGGGRAGRSGARGRGSADRRPSRQCRRHQGGCRGETVPRLPFLREGGARQDGAQPLGDRRPGARCSGRICLFGSHESQGGRAVELRDARPFHRRPQGIPAGHKNELRRPQEGRKPAPISSPTAHPVRQPGAAARSAGRRRRTGRRGPEAPETPPAAPPEGETQAQ